MALFGQKKPVNPLGVGIGQAPVPAMQTPEPMGGGVKRKGGGLFGKDSALWKVLGTLGDGITGNPVYSQTVLARKKMEHDAEMQQAKRAADLEDYAKKQEIEAQYRPEQRPHMWESNNGSLMQLDPTTGLPKVVYEDPTPKINWIRADNGDGTFTMVPVGPNGPLAGAPQAPKAPKTAPRGKMTPYSGGQTVAPSGTFRPIGIPGERVTSTYRTPEHNRKVGGVPNSYHTRKGRDGNPLARDSVPPPGISMAAYAADIRRRNPGLKVINEGDHVHIEPRG